MMYRMGAAAVIGHTRLAVVLDTWRRCTAHHIKRGYQCQLIAGHEGPHFTPATPHGQPPLSWARA